MRKEVFGDATLYLGDCFDILPACGLSGLDLLLTDPPYGCTRNAWDRPINLSAFWEMLWTMLKQNAACCIFSQMPFSAELVFSQKRFFRYDLVYQKQNAVGFLNANRMPLRSHELICVFYRRLPTYNLQKTRGKPYSRGIRTHNSDNYDQLHKGYFATCSKDGARYPTSVIPPMVEQAMRSSSPKKNHPTQKPVALNAWLIKTYTNPRETVLDPFMGAGSMGVAALKCGRKFIGVEQEEKYFTTACYRMEKALQGTALLRSVHPQKQAEQVSLMAEAL